MKAGSILFIRRSSDKSSIMSIGSFGKEPKVIISGTGRWLRPHWGKTQDVVYAIRQSRDKKFEVCRVTNGKAVILQTLKGDFRGFSYDSIKDTMVWTDTGDLGTIHFLTPEHKKHGKLVVKKGLVANPILGPNGKMFLVQTNWAHLENPNGGVSIQEQLWLVPRNGALVSRLTKNDDRYYESGVWSPDGKSLAVVSANYKSRVPFQFQLELIDADTGVHRKVVALPPGNQVCSGGVDWSPDGTSIVCSLTSDDNESSSLYIINLSKQNAIRRLTVGSKDLSPNWSN